MPEGDAVWRTAKRLHDALAGHTLTDWDLRWARWATTDLRGSTTLEVVPRGKHLLHRMDSGHTLHTHLRMEGSWRVFARTGVRPASLRRPDIRALLGTDEHWAMGLRLGMVDLVRTEREDSLVGHLGPDPLGEWDADLAANNLATRATDAIGALLLDQRLVAGLGTIWVTETLFAERVHPLTKAGDCDLSAIAIRSAVLLNQAIRERGRPRNAAYGRRGPCLRCNSPIRTVRVGTPPEDRQLYFCSGCQSPRAS